MTQRVLRDDALAFPDHLRIAFVETDLSRRRQAAFLAHVVCLTSSPARSSPHSRQTVCWSMVPPQSACSKSTGGPLGAARRSPQCVRGTTIGWRSRPFSVRQYSRRTRFRYGRRVGVRQVHRSVAEALSVQSNLCECRLRRGRGGRWPCAVSVVIIAPISAAAARSGCRERASTISQVGIDEAEGNLRREGRQ